MLIGSLFAVSRRPSDAFVSAMQHLAAGVVFAAAAAEILPQVMHEGSPIATFTGGALGIVVMLSLTRTVGATVDIEIVGAVGLWPTEIDAGQLENAILNLCINGRDAMPEGGKLTIETANKWLDEHASKERGVPPGQYVSICVTDSGTGIRTPTRSAIAMARKRRSDSPTISPSPTSCRNRPIPAR